MTVEAFKDAVAKGLGRAVLCLEANDPTPYTDAIVAACITCVQYDRSFEESRATYLMWLVDRAGLQERVLDEILSALPKTEERRDRSQMFELLAIYARRGQEQAWQILVDQALAVDFDEADSYLPEVGFRGLTWLIDNIMPNLSTDNSWLPKSWLREVEEQFGPEESAALDPAIRADIIRLDEEHSARTARNRPEQPQKTVREAIDAVMSGSSALLTLAMVAKKATDAELVEIAERLIETTDYQIARRLVWAFKKRTFPLDPKLVINRTREEDLGWLFLQLLGKINAPEVHDFAISLIGERPIHDEAFSSLRATVQPEDMPIIEAALPSLVERDENEMHSFTIDLRILSEKLPSDITLGLNLWLYEHSPCSFCREGIVEGLQKSAQLPEYIREEARWDAESGTRGVVRPPSVVT